MPVSLEQQRAAVGAMARSAAAIKSRSPVGRQWNKYQSSRDSDPMAYQACAMFLLTIARMVVSGVKQRMEKMKEMMKKGQEGVYRLASRGRSQVLAMRLRPRAVLVTSLLMILLCGHVLQLNYHDTSGAGSGELCPNPVREETVSEMMMAGVCEWRRIVSVNQMLLMIAGDVEPNPGPGKKRYFMDSSSMKFSVELDAEYDLITVVEELYTVKDQWYQIGIQLNLETDDLNRIKIEWLNNPDGCLRKVIYLWLTRDTPHTWERIVDVLSSLAVDRPAMAERIRQTYCSTQGQTNNQKSVMEPLSESLHSSDLAALMNELHEVRDKWYSIGIELNMQADYLNRIRIKCNSNPEECLRKMLTEWLALKKPLPTWERVVDALCSPAIDRPDRAQHIREIYCIKNVCYYFVDLTEDDLPILMNELFEVRDKWYNIGIQLNLQPYELNSIKIQYKNNSKDCLMEILVFWTRKNGISNPTWLGIENALSSPTVDRPDIAKRIRQTYYDSPLVPANEQVMLQLFPLNPDYDLATLVNELYEVKYVWFHIGIQLNISYNKLCVIRHDNRNNPMVCLTEMLMKWLTLKEKSSPPTWERVMNALCSRVVDRPVVAQRIRQVYCNPEHPHNDQVKDLQSTASLPLNLGDLDILVNELSELSYRWYHIGIQLNTGTCLREILMDNPENCLGNMLEEWLRHEKPSPPTWEKVVAALCSPTVHRLDIAQRIRKIYCSHQEPVNNKIKIKFFLTIEDIQAGIDILQYEFEELKYDIYSSLQTQPVDLLKHKLTSFKAKNNELHMKYINIVEDTSTVKDIWRELNEYLNFFNLPLLQHISSDFSDSKLQHRLNSYKHELHAFFRETRICDFVQCWSIDKDPLEAELKELVVKSKKEWDTCTLEDLEEQGLAIQLLLLLPAYNQPFHVELEKEKEDKKLYDLAMTRGHVESGLTFIVLTGVTGSGKTEFKRLVFGKKVPKHSPSTPLAEAAVRSMSVCQAATSEMNLNWIEIDPDTMMKMVASTIKEGAWEEEIRYHGNPSRSTERMDVNTASDRAPPTKKSMIDPDEPPCEETMQVEYHEVMPHCQVKPQSSVNRFTDAVNIDSTIQRSMRTYETNQKLKGVDFIYLLDSGGQPAFREMLPHFVQRASAIVLMQKLNERLDYKPIIRYREEGRKEDKGYTSQLTNEQILHQYVQAVQSHNSEVFVIGTHRDKEDECEGETREDKNQKLFEALWPVLGKQLELYKVDQPIFPVNCTSREPDDEEIAREFRKRVMDKCMGEKEKIPLPWFTLEQLLQLLAQKMKVSVLNVNECCEIAKDKLLMPRNVCEAALRYLGRLNIIFYRPDILPRVVFSSAQVILDKLTELARCNHALRTEGGDSDAVPSYIHTNSHDGKQFKQFGLLTSAFLQNAFPSHYREDLFTAPDLLLLLERMLIAGRLNSGEHFIPSLLPELPVEEIAEYRATADHPPPLVIYYPKMWLPVGVMSSLVVYLQNECGWVPATARCKPTCMMHNCMEFILSNEEPGSTVLIATKFLEIHVKPTNKLDHTTLQPLLHRIRNNVLAGLQEAHDSLHYKPPHTEFGFLCPGKCGSIEQHYATLVGGNKKWRCSEDNRSGGELDEMQKLWLQKESHTCDYRGEGPTLPKLLRLNIPEGVGVNYTKFGIFLLNDKTGGTVAAIENQHKSDATKIIISILTKWLDGKGEPVSWETLVETLKDAGLIALAKKVKDKYCTSP